MVWTTWSVPGLLAGCIALGLATLVVRSGRGSRVSQLIATALFLDGVFTGGTLGLVFLIQDPVIARRVAVGSIGLATAIPFVHLLLIGEALDTPVVRPLRSRFAGVTLTTLAIAGVGLVLLSPDRFVSEAYPTDWAASNVEMLGWGVGIMLGVSLVMWFALGASVYAYAKAPEGTAGRERARSFALAFGARDSYLAVLFLFSGVLRPIPFWGDLLFNPGLATATLVYMSLLGYGVLRHQIFDIDLKVRVALVRSGLLSLVAVGFFVGSELLEAVVPIEGTILGLVVAAGVVLTLNPLRARVERLVDVLMPGVESTTEYLSERRAAVYKAAYEAGVADGKLTKREEIILDRLAEELELPTSLRAELEAAVSAALAGRAVNGAH